MSHDPLFVGGCSCGADKKCPRCGFSVLLIGYDNDPRHGFGHIWDSCESCDRATSGQ